MDHKELEIVEVKVRNPNIFTFTIKLQFLDCCFFFFLQGFETHLFVCLDFYFEKPDTPPYSFS